MIFTPFSSQYFSGLSIVFPAFITIQMLIIQIIIRNPADELQDQFETSLLAVNAAAGIFCRKIWVYNKGKKETFLWGGRL